ncbi:MAG: L-aspartate oxidase [Candidatus Eisenbacteria bacterium]|nr:L-aspartate oxidase [Candidatus Eisenbacteria bacterium]
MRTAEFVVVGSGIAGLTFALSVADRGRVVIVTKKGDAETATNTAQGGIAAVMDETDSFEKHIEDTLVAGVGLCNREAVEVAVRRGPEAVRKLAAWGASFSTEEGRAEAPAFALGREGGHSGRRIVHAADMTGREIEQALLAAVERHPDIEILEDHLAVDLAVAGPPGARRCVGVHVLDIRGQAVDTIGGSVTVLATGGCGKVYLYTTNPDIATGDGVAMALRAGVPVRNMEFIQFHPTCLYHPTVKSFLISEAVRGEGAVLTTLSGRRIMEGVHPRADLAPRDIVARAIDKTMKTTGDKHALLDATGIGAERLRARFPMISGRLAELGIDVAREPIPVVPAAHYLCGGVAVDLDARTELPGLLAMGETAHTGMHGANRLASNSLLEAVVFGERGARAAIEDARSLGRPGDVPAWSGGSPGAMPEGVVIDHNWDVVRRLMWDYVGIVRTERRLSLARERMLSIRNEVSGSLAAHPLSADLIELRNICLVGDLIVRSALERRESRGLHFIEDYPDRDDARFARDTVVREGPVV